jgi:hypothetical protein
MKRRPQEMRGSCEYILNKLLRTAEMGDNPALLLEVGLTNPQININLLKKLFC